jgi:hypothetical protein
MSAPKFDFDTFRRLLAPSHVPPYARSGRVITSPFDIIVCEELRRQAATNQDLGPTKSADIFVFALGEAPCRAVTKIGGLPYRPASVAWPRGQTGKPYTFLCQFRFSESHDLVGPLPGEMLLVFRRDPDLYPDDGGFFFEWFPLGLDDLVGPSALPEPGWSFVTCHGFRHRTHDYLSARALTELQRVVPREADHAFASRALRRLEGMKIGGAPMYAPNERPRKMSKFRFLCQLSTVSPVFELPLPWVNRLDPIQSWQELRAQQLLFADGFSALFFIDNHKIIRWQLLFH